MRYSLLPIQTIEHEIAHRGCCLSFILTWQIHRAHDGFVLKILTAMSFVFVIISIAKHTVYQMKGHDVWLSNRFLLSSNTNLW